MQEFPNDRWQSAASDTGPRSFSPELHIVPKLEKAAEMGVSASALGYAMNALVDGAFAATIGMKRASIWSSAAMPTMQLIRTIWKILPVRTPSGKTVRLSSIADVILSRSTETG